MSKLLALADSKNIPRGLFGFFKKERGDGAHITSAAKCREKLNDLVTAGKEGTPEFKSAEDAFYFHTMSHMYLEDRTSTKKHALYLGHLASGEEYFKDPARAYKFLTFVTPHTLLVAAGRSYLLAAPPVLWEEFEFVFTMLNTVASFKDLLDKNNKTLLEFVEDVRESMKDLHLHFWSFNKTADNLLKNLSFKEMEVEHRKEACASILQVMSAKSNDGTPMFKDEAGLLPVFEKFLDMLSVNKTDLVVKAIGKQLTPGWNRAYRPDSGLAGTKNYSSDPFASVLTDFAILSKDEKAKIKAALKDKDVQNIVYTFAVGKEAKAKSPDNVQAMLATSLIDFTAFPKVYRDKAGSSYNDSRSLQAAVTSFLNEKIGPLREKLASSFVNSGLKLDLDNFLERALGRRKSDIDFLRVFDVSEFMDDILAAYKTFYKMNVAKLEKIAENHKEFFEMFSDIFSIEVKKNMEWINSPAYVMEKGKRISKVFDALNLAYDMSDEDLAKIAIRLNEREDRELFKCMDACEMYARYSIVNATIKSFRKKDQVKFKMRDLNFGSTPKVDDGSVVQGAVQ